MKKISFAKYDEETEKFLTLVRKINPELNIVQFGEVEAPGMSDIDILAMTESAKDIQNLKKIMKTEFDFIEPIKILTKDQYKDFHILTHHKINKVLNGNLKVPKELDKKNKKLYDLLFFVELLQKSLFRNFILLNKKGDRWKIKRVLNTLYDLRRIVERLDSLSISAKEQAKYKKFIQKIKQERINFESSRREDLKKYSQEANELLFSIILNTDNELKKYTSGISQKKAFISGTYFALFKKNYSKKDYYYAYRKNLPILPMSFFYVISEYIATPGQYTDTLKHKMYPKLNSCVKEKLKIAISKRATLLNSQYTFAKKQKMPYGWFYSYDLFDANHSFFHLFLFVLEKIRTVATHICLFLHK